MARWAADLLAAERPPGPETALYFGLFQPIQEGVVGTDLYLAGGDRTSEDWVRAAAHYWPEGRYAYSPLLARLYAIAYQPAGLGNDAEYPLALGFAALTVAAIARTAPTALTGPGGQKRWLATGFDSGDILEIGFADQAGLTLSLSWI